MTIPNQGKVMTIPNQGKVMTIPNQGKVMTIPNQGKVINTLKAVFPNGEHGKIKAQRKKLNTPAITDKEAIAREGMQCTVDSNEG